MKWKEFVEFNKTQNIFLHISNYFYFFEDMILAFAKLNCFPLFLTFIIPVSYHKNLKSIKLCLISVKLTTLSQLLYQVPDCSRVIRLHLFLIATTYGDFWRKFDTTILVHLYTTGIKPNFLILHQFLLSKPCSFYWGLLESSNPDLIVSSWIPSFGNGQNFELIMGLYKKFNSIVDFQMCLMLMYWCV